MIDLKSNKAKQLIISSVVQLETNISQLQQLCFMFAAELISTVITPMAVFLNYISSKMTQRRFNFPLTTQYCTVLLVSAFASALQEINTC